MPYATRWGLNRDKNMKRIQFELIIRLQECAEMATYVALNINGYPQTEKPIEDSVRDIYNQTNALMAALQKIIEKQMETVGV